MHCRIATLPGLATPRQRRPDPRGLNGIQDRGVLHRIDFTEQQGDVGIDSRARIARIRDYQHAVQPHRPLDPRFGAGLEQVRARAQLVPRQVLTGSPDRYLGRERAHAVRLARRCENGIAGTGIGTTRRAGPGRPLRGMHGTGHRRALGHVTQAATHLPDDHERGRHVVEGGGSPSPGRAECATR